MQAHDEALPIHPFTGLRAVGIVAGKPVWPIRGGDGTGGDGSGDGGPGGGGAGDTYTPPASQADLDKIIEQRLARERSKYAGHDDIVKERDQYKNRIAELEADLGTDADRAAKKAADEARAEILKETTPRLVRSEFRAAAKGVLTDEQLGALLEDLDLSKYLDAKGDVDEEKVSKKVAAFAPKDDGKGTQQRHLNLGQGNHQQSTAKPGDQGRAQAEKRFAKKS